MTNIIIQALIDSQAQLGSLRKYADSQERAKLDALCSHLTYLVTTTEVMPMQPSTLSPGDVLPAADTTLLRAADLGPSTCKTHEGITTAGRAIAQESLTPEAQIAAVVEADKKLAEELRSITEDDLMRMNPDPDRATKNLGETKPDTLYRSPVYIGRHGKQGVRWVPEAPNHNGLYAFESKQSDDQRNCTVNIREALQFESLELCKAWCDKRPPLMFLPREHMFIWDIA